MKASKSSIAAICWNENGKVDLTFSNGDRLQLFDSDKRDEACSIQGGRTQALSKARGWFGNLRDVGNILINSSKPRRDV